jgi:hypothetical protein
LPGTKWNRIYTTVAKRKEGPKKAQASSSFFDKQLQVAERATVFGEAQAGYKEEKGLKFLKNS